MASIAEAKTGRRLAWELSVVNVDKPMLDYVSIHDRVQSLRWSDPHRLILLSTAPTYREKARFFPGSVFVVGADTIARIADPKYYDDDSRQRDAAIAEFAEADCSFLVFGRTIDGQFQTCPDLPLPPALVSLCQQVSGEQFRDDVSSTQLRMESADRPPAA